jgi:asparagine N-glycosylation enzyme membrane subunit Stt3
VINIGKNTIRLHKSLSGVTLAFELIEEPEFAGQVFYPVSTRYSYMTLQILSLIAGLVLLLYRKFDEKRVYMVVLACIFFLSGVISMIGMEATIRAINNEPCYSCDGENWRNIDR